MAINMTGNVAPTGFTTESSISESFFEIGRALTMPQQCFPRVDQLLPASLPWTNRKRSPVRNPFPRTTCLADVPRVRVDEGSPRPLGGNGFPRAITLLWHQHRVS